MLQFVDKKFRVDHDATVGVEFGAKTINSKSKNVKLQIWDTVSRLLFSFHTELIYNRPDKNLLNQLQDLIIEGKNLFKNFYFIIFYKLSSICGILVYDITRKETFENITKWLEETKNYANESMTIVLVGNKTDLAAQLKIS